MYNSINRFLKISLLLVNIYNNTDCQQRQNIAVALYHVEMTHSVTSCIRVCVCLNKKCGKDQESIQPCTTPDTGYHMGK